jgi:uncharacterized OB-fold protein
VNVAVTDAELVERYPDVPLDHDNKAQWKGFLDRRLLIARCGDCGHWFNPPRPMCPHCWSDRVAPHEVSGRGRVQWFTLLFEGEVDPTVAVVVELEEQPGLRVTSTIIDCPAGEVVCDMPVELDWQDFEGAPIPVFRPVGSKDTTKGGYG